MKIQPWLSKMLSVKFSEPALVESSSKLQLAGVRAHVWQKLGQTFREAADSPALTTRVGFCESPSLHVACPAAVALLPLWGLLGVITSSLGSRAGLWPHHHHQDVFPTAQLGFHPDLLKFIIGAVRSGEGEGSWCISKEFRAKNQ